MILEFKGKIFQWHGPAPYLFKAENLKENDEIKTGIELQGL